MKRLLVSLTLNAGLCMTIASASECRILLPDLDYDVSKIKRVLEMKGYTVLNPSTFYTRDQKSSPKPYFNLETFDEYSDYELPTFACSLALARTSLIDTGLRLSYHNEEEDLSDETIQETTTHRFTQCGSTLWFDYNKGWKEVNWGKKKFEVFSYRVKDLKTCAESEKDLSEILLRKSF